MSRLLLTLSCLLLTGTSTLATSTSGFPQYPSLSPDGSMTVFSLGGDLWAVPTGGGHAERLTSNESDELKAAFHRTVRFWPSNPTVTARRVCM